RTQVVGGEHCLQELGTVVRQQSHDIAATHAAVGQPARKRGRTLSHLGVADRRALEDRDRLVRRASRMVMQDGEPVHVRRQGLGERHVTEYVPTSRPTDPDLQMTAAVEYVA